MRVPEVLWSLTDQGVIDEVVRPLKSGKEAQVYLVRAGGDVRVAKVYKDASERSFKQRTEEARRAPRPPDPERPPVLMPPPEEAPGEPVHLRVAGGVGVGLGAGPLPHTTFTLAAGLRYMEAGLMLSLRYADTFAAGDVDGGYALRARILRTRLSACYLPRPLELCATGSVGLHEVEPKGLTDARVGQAVFGAVGGLIAALVEVDEHVSVRFDLELAASLNQVSFTVVGANSWTVWPVIVELGVSFLYEP